MREKNLFALQQGQTQCPNSVSNWPAEDGSGVADTIKQTSQERKHFHRLSSFEGIRTQKRITTFLAPDRPNFAKAIDRSPVRSSANFSGNKKGRKLTNWLQPTDRPIDRGQIDGPTLVDDERFRECRLPDRTIRGECFNFSIYDFRICTRVRVLTLFSPFSSGCVREMRARIDWEKCNELPTRTGL